MTASVHQTEHMLFTILAQLIVMIGAARGMNTLFRRAGQPGVIGEIVAGLLLGPSLLGHFAPGFSTALFGAKPAPAIVIISQLGLILLMFQIGMDFEFGHLSQSRAKRGVLWVALASVSVPFALGLGLGVLSAPVLAPGINPAVYALFLGVGLAITAVPILGRILRQFDLNRTEVGTVAISAAAVNDVAGWVMLAAVSALAAAQFTAVKVGLQLLEIMGFGAVLWFAGRPLADRLVRGALEPDGGIRPNIMAAILCLMFACAIATFSIGIFAIFGGFAAGLLFHRHVHFVEAWRAQVGRFVIVFFLPVFFTFTGLRTNVLGLDTGDAWAWAALILLASVAGKILPVFLAARASGFGRDDAMTLGVLMNTRALMELIVLNIGYELGFLPQSVFTMLVLMAVTTTLMTGPLLGPLLRRVGHRVPEMVEA